MIDKKPQITDFIKSNFKPGTPEENSFFCSTTGFLEILFQIFPSECIDTDDLFDILTSLNYKPVKVDSKKFQWCVIEL